MKAPRPPRHMVRLAELLGCTPAQALARLAEMRKAVDPHGITVAFVPRVRQWWISGFVGTGTRWGCLKCSAESFVEYLETPQSVIDFWEKKHAAELAAEAALAADAA